MFKLRKKNPPFGTAETPVMEYAYSEQVKVIDGLCDVKHPATRDYLLKVGYEEIRDEEPVAAGVSAGNDMVADQTTTGHQETPSGASHRRTSSKKFKKRR